MTTQHTNAGWIGPTQSVIHYLATVGADRNENKQFLIYNVPPTAGIGGDEMVVPAETSYSVDGQRYSLAGGLRSTSYGLGVVVI